jgi:inositol transport system permease protein
MNNVDASVSSRNGIKMASRGTGAIMAYFSKYRIFVVFLGICILLSILSPAFLKTRNLMNVVRQISIIGVISMSMTMVIISGGIDLSAGSIVALVSVMSSLFGQSGTHPLYVTILAGCGVGILCGFITGFLIAKTGIPPFIATLGMFTTARGVALLISRGEPIGNLSIGFEFIGGGYVLGIPVPIIIFLVIIAISGFILAKTKLGKYIYGIGGNENAARICGVNVSKYKIIIYTLEGLFCAIAAIILTGRISAGSGTSGSGYELDAIAASVIGGTSMSGGVGQVGGTVVGVLIIGVLNNGLDLLKVSPYWQQILKGVIIVGAVIMDTRKTKQH